MTLSRSATGPLHPHSIPAMLDASMTYAAGALKPLPPHPPPRATRASAARHPSSRARCFIVRSLPGATSIGPPDPRGGKRRLPDLSSAAAFVLLVLLVAFGAGMLWVLAEIRPGPLAELSGAPEVALVRRDAVRELAISRGIIPETARAAVRPIVPTEASPPE